MSLADTVPETVQSAVLPWPALWTDAQKVWVGNTAEEPVISATYRPFLPNSKTEKKTSRVDVASACNKRPLGATQAPPQRTPKHRAAKQADKSQVGFSLYSLYARVWNEVS